MFKKLSIILSILLLSTNLYAGTVSFDQLATSSDLTAAKYNLDMNTIYQDHNTNIQSSNIQADTVSESDMADDANPRLRDYELGGFGTECEMVYQGLLTTTTSGTLTGSIPSGTAYPRGYRIIKSSNTSKTWTASKWTYYDIDINGNFTYSEVAIGASAPSVATNSIRVARVSTDGTQVTSVQDLRTTSCTAGTFLNTTSGTSEPSLDDIFKSGVANRRFSPVGRSSQGFSQGAFVSFDTTSTFKVTAGSLYINGEYRAISTDITVTTGADDPTNGVSGLDTGSVTGGPVTYYVYGVADQSAVKPYSVSYSTSSSAPSGVTNYRLIGSIKTDATNLFTSRDVYSSNAITEKELPLAWANFDGSAGTITPADAYNVSGLVDGGAGLYTVTIDSDANSANLTVVCSGKRSADTSGIMCVVAAVTSGTAQVQMRNASDGATDTTLTNVLIFGDGRK